MSDPVSRLSALSRPGLLVRAAKFGLAEFNRSRILRRLLPGEVSPPPGKALDMLFEREAEMENARRTGTASYSPARHIELLAALIHEAQIAEHRIAA